MTVNLLDFDLEAFAETEQLAIANNPDFQLDDRELKRTGPSYTLDTLRSLRSELSEQDSLVLFIGSDAFKQFNRWHQWQEIIRLCHIALVARPDSEVSTGLDPELVTFLQDHYTENAMDLQSATAGLITMQAITPLTISSSAIREQARTLILRHGAHLLSESFSLSHTHSQTCIQRRQNAL